MKCFNKTIITILIIVLTFSCQSDPEFCSKTRFYQIAADIDGNYLSLYEGNTSNQCGYDSHLNKIINNIESQKIDENGKVKILLFIHGGLNSIHDNYERVIKHSEHALADGYYPIFISWRSGPLTTVKDRYFSIRNGVKRPLRVTVPSSLFYFSSDILRGVASLPESAWDQFSNLILTTQKDLTSYDESDISSYKKDIQKYKFSLLYTGKGDAPTSKEKDLYAIKQYFPGILKLITTPFIEGIADKAWNVMLRRAKTLMYRQEDLMYNGGEFSPGLKNERIYKLTNCQVKSQHFKLNKPNGIIAQLMRALKKVQAPISITLVGHSMGAIISNDIVEEFPNLHYEKIIHMASADSIRNLMIKTAPYLKSHPDTYFYNLMLHPQNEEQEQSAYGAVPEGSLLIWLDYILINPETTLDRRAGRWQNIKWAFPFFSNNQNMYFKLFGVRNTYSYSERNILTDFDSKTTEPISHGGFGDFKFWRQEFYWKNQDE